MIDYNRKNLPQSRVELTITLPETDFKKYYEAAFQKLAADVEVKGFRPGKAPRNLAEAHIGPDKIFSEALDAALPEIYAEVIKREKLIPVERPHIHIKEIDPKKPLIFEAKFDVLPKVALPDYSKVKITKDKVNISAKELAESIENIKKSYAEFSPKKDGAKLGDKIEIDFEGFVKNVKIDSLVSKNHPIVLGQTKLIPGFTEKLLGAKAGEEKEFKIAMPEDIPDKLVAGKNVDFRIKVKKVEKINYPEINEKFVKKISKFKTVREFEEQLKKSIEAQKEMEEEGRKQNEVVKKISQMTSLEISESLIKLELERMIEDMTQRLESSGGTLDGWLASIKKSKEDFQKELRGQAKEAVKINLIISAIREKEKIKIEEKEIDAEIQLEKLRGHEIPDDESTRRYVANILGNRKVIKKLVEDATK